MDSKPASEVTAQPAAKKVLVCVVASSDRGDVSIITAQSLVKLQMRMMTDPTVGMTIDLSFVRTFDDALSLLWKRQDADAALVVSGTQSFQPDFLVEAVRSGLPLVAGTCPLPVIDWERVKSWTSKPDAEPLDQAGNVYNVSLTGTYDKHGYGLARREDAHLNTVLVRRAALEDIAARHPEVLAGDDAQDPPDASFATAGTYDGVKMTEHQRFLHLFGGDVWADLQRPGVTMGLTEFGGCVGLRTVLR